MGEWRSCADLVALFADGVGNGVARLVAFYADLLAGQIDFDDGVRIDFAHGVYHGTLAVAAGHAFNGELVLHKNSLGMVRQGTTGQPCHARAQAHHEA